MLNGISIPTTDGGVELFNVLPIMCADLSFVKEVIGKCSSTSRYGCFYCKRQIKDWDSDKLTKTQHQNMLECVSLGQEALKVPREHPDHDISKFKTFQHSHFG